MHIPLRAPGALAALIVAATCPAGRASDPVEKTLVYRLRGEVRSFLFWMGRDDVGGGRITIRRTYSSPARWREEIEVPFGSEPERIPEPINRWGYGWESAEWIRDEDAAAPRLWTPLAGDLKGMPVRIALQPRWWLRLQLDLDPGAQAGSERQ